MQYDLSKIYLLVFDVFVCRRKDLAEGEPATTLVVCPHVKAWQSFEAFQEFYQGQLLNGYFFAEKARIPVALRHVEQC